MLLGAGAPPPELAGRVELVASATTALIGVALGPSTPEHDHGRSAEGGQDRSSQHVNDLAESERFKTALVEAHEGKSLPELLAPSLRSICYGLSAIESAKDMARRSLRGLKGFMSGSKVTVDHMDVGLSIDGESGLADRGDIEADLPDLIVAVGQAARAAKRPFALLIGESQSSSETEFSALIVSIHICSQKSLPVLLIGAGLPQNTALAGNSKSYAERLFRFPEIAARETMRRGRPFGSPRPTKASRLRMMPFSN